MTATSDTVPPGPPSPPAVRLRRPGWRDPRLLLGLVLVAGSVALGSSVVSAAARTVPVYVASGPLVPGDAVGPDVLAVREVGLGDVGAGYLRADEPLPDDLVATRTVAAGELVPVSAVAAGADLGLRPVAITPDGPLPAGLTEGAQVDLWFVPPPPAVARADVGVPGAAAGDGLPAPGAGSPRELATSLVVAEVSQPRGGFSIGAAGATVHVLVPVDELSAVLAALASDGAVQVVLVPGAS